MNTMDGVVQIQANRRRIEILMANKGMTVSDIMRVSGLARQTVRSIVHGKSVKPVTFGRFAKAMGVPVEDIIDDREHK